MSVTSNLPIGHHCAVTCIILAPRAIIHKALRISLLLVAFYYVGRKLSRYTCKKSCMIQYRIKKQPYWTLLWFWVHVTSKAGVNHWKLHLVHHSLMTCSYRAYRTSNLVNFPPRQNAQLPPRDQFIFYLTGWWPFLSLDAVISILASTTVTSQPECCHSVLCVKCAYWVGPETKWDWAHHFLID